MIADSLAAYFLAICQAQTPACFYSTGSIITPTETKHGIKIISQDTPTPGYANRWHYIIDTVLPESSTVNVQICGEAVMWQDPLPIHGGMYQQAWPYWRLDMHPVNNAVSKQFGIWAGAFECRIQNFFIHPFQPNPNWTEIYIEEPGENPITPLWLPR